MELEMKRSLTAFATLTLVLAGPASAVTILVDDFNVENQAVSAPDYVTSTSAGTVGAAGARTITHELGLGVAIDNSPSQGGAGGLSFATVGPDYANSTLMSHNGDGYTSQVTLSWTVSNGFLNLASGGPLALTFDVKDTSLDTSHLGIAALSFNNVALGSTAVPYSHLGSNIASISLDAAQLSTINHGGTLVLSFTNPAVGYDMTVDNVRFETPSPVPEVSTSLMLLAGLAGMAGLRRRTAHQAA
jgi:hypothetical protein